MFIFFLNTLWFALLRFVWSDRLTKSFENVIGILVVSSIGNIVNCNRRVGNWADLLYRNHVSVNKHYFIEGVDIIAQGYVHVEKLSEYTVLIFVHVYLHFWDILKVLVNTVSAFRSYWSHHFFVKREHTCIYHLLHVYKPMKFIFSINWFKYTKLINVLQDNWIWSNLPLIYIFY